MELCELRDHMHLKSSNLDNVKAVYNVMYSLNGFSMFVVIFTAHNGSREALNLFELHHRLPYRFHPNCLITVLK